MNRNLIHFLLYHLSKNSQTVFSSLLSLAYSLFYFQNKKPNQFYHQICQILSARPLRSSVLSGLFQSIMSDDYHEDDIDHQMPSNHHKIQTTSATLNRISSLYHLLTHPPSHLLENAEKERDIYKDQFELLPNHHHHPNPNPIPIPTHHKINHINHENQQLN
ncbi:hypothetical protein O181_061224 [Austropuccinia psidii MF-1]|uniref:Uncharacterized protein n=1 Tax=Austropuccinia psidii MF-1 TaxID=1389203 RepID=A0A9Q3EHX4_9BASI|nr:hypothetical protein [Austropuccinia psidii MF-1]